MRGLGQVGAVGVIDRGIAKVKSKFIHIWRQASEGLSLETV